MKCPYCDQEMIPGYLQSGREIYFTEKPHKVLFSHKDGEILLTEKNMTAPTCTAYCCAGCKRIIVEYKNNSMN